MTPTAPTAPGFDALAAEDAALAQAMAHALTDEVILVVEAGLQRDRATTEAHGTVAWASFCRDEILTTMTTVFGMTPIEAEADLRDELAELLAEGVGVDEALEQILGAQRLVVASGQGPRVRAEVTLARARAAAAETMYHGGANA